MLFFRKKQGGAVLKKQVIRSGISGYWFL